MCGSWTGTAGIRSLIICRGRRSAPLEPPKGRAFPEQTLGLGYEPGKGTNTVGGQGAVAQSRKCLVIAPRVLPASRCRQFSRPPSGIAPAELCRDTRSEPNLPQLGHPNWATTPVYNHRHPEQRHPDRFSHARTRLPLSTIRRNRFHAGRS